MKQSYITIAKHAILMFNVPKNVYESKKFSVFANHVNWLGFSFKDFLGIFFFVFVIRIIVIVLLGKFFQVFLFLFFLRFWLNKTFTEFFFAFFLFGSAFLYLLAISIALETLIEYLRNIRVI